MKKIIFFILIGIMLSPYYLPAQITTMPPCYRSLQTEFFPYSLVAQSASLNNIWQDQWDKLYRDLSANSQLVPSLIETKASRMVPNPLSPPFNYLAAAALLRETLFEIFSATLQNNYITNPATIRGMFRYIRSQQAGRLRACLGEEVVPYETVTE